MTKLSSNSLFHFTHTAENLINILRNGFKPRFCLEEIGIEHLLEEDVEKRERAVPMTCFCDIPLSKISTHLEFYGSYGIGLNKEWGKNNGLTPITYIHENSVQIKHLKKIGSSIMNSYLSENKTTKICIDESPVVALFELSAFFKPYEGEMWRINKYVTKKFYDEREWRYVPLINTENRDYRLHKEEFLNETKRANANGIIGREFPLKFNYEEVKYLIVKNESEMVALYDAIDSMEDIYSLEERKILKTKIISTEQIKEDF